MSLTAIAPDLRLLFVERTHSRPLLVDPGDRATGSRVGGAPPEAISADDRRCARCGATLLYVLTLEGDVLGEAVARARAASLLACGGGCLGPDPVLGEGHASVVVVHSPSARGAATEWQWAPEGRGLSAGALELDPDPALDAVQPGDPPEWASRAWPAPPPRRGSKVGGPPGFLRGPPAIEMEAEGSGFLCQIADDLGAIECGARAFLLGGDGAFYLYGRVDGALPSLDDVRGFSQF
jgi:hypothetical protein